MIEYNSLERGEGVEKVDIPGNTNLCFLKCHTTAFFLYVPAHTLAVPEDKEQLAIMRAFACIWRDKQRATACYHSLDRYMSICDTKVRYSSKEQHICPPFALRAESRAYNIS